MDDIVKLRDAFKESASILDELLDLQDKEETPEMVKQCECLMGRFVIKMAEIDALNFNL